MARLPFKWTYLCGRARVVQQELGRMPGYLEGTLPSPEASRLSASHSIFADQDYGLAFGCIHDGGRSSQHPRSRLEKQNSYLRRLGIREPLNTNANGGNASRLTETVQRSPTKTLREVAQEEESCRLDLCLNSIRNTRHGGFDHSIHATTGVTTPATTLSCPSKPDLNSIGPGVPAYWVEKRSRH
jgi:hypothetical protein